MSVDLFRVHPSLLSTTSGEIIERIREGARCSPSCTVGVARWLLADREHRRVWTYVCMIAFITVTESGVPFVFSHYLGLVYFCFGKEGSVRVRLVTGLSMVLCMFSTV